MGKAMSTVFYKYFLEVGVVWIIGDGSILNMIVDLHLKNLINLIICHPRIISPSNSF